MNRELKQKIDRDAAVWWAQKAPLRELSQHEFCAAVREVVSPHITALEQHVAALLAELGRRETCPDCGGRPGHAPGNRCGRCWHKKQQEIIDSMKVK